MTRALLVSAMANHHSVTATTRDVSEWVAVHRRAVLRCRDLTTSQVLLSLRKEYEFGVNDSSFSLVRMQDRMKRDGFVGGLQYEVARGYLDGKYDRSEDLVYWSLDHQGGSFATMYGGFEAVTVLMRPTFSRCLARCECEYSCTPGDSLFSYLEHPTLSDLANFKPGDVFPSVVLNDVRLADDLLPTCDIAVQVDRMHLRWPEFGAASEKEIVVRPANLPKSLPFYASYIEIQSGEVDIEQDPIEGFVVHTVVDSVLLQLEYPFRPPTYERLLDRFRSVGADPSATAAAVQLEHPLAAETLVDCLAKTGKIDPDHQLATIKLMIVAATVQALGRIASDLDLRFEVLRP